jgi:hypothetical protein
MRLQLIDEFMFLFVNDNFTIILMMATLDNLILLTFYLNILAILDRFYIYISHGFFYALSYLKMLLSH